MAKRQMSDLDEAVLARSHEEVQVTDPAQLVVSREAGKRDYADFCRPRRGHRGEDIGRLPRAADGDQEIACAGMELQLLGKDILVPEIIAKTGQRRRIVERERPQPTVFGKIDGEMAGDGRAAAIADKDNLVSSIVDGM